MVVRNKNLAVLQTQQNQQQLNKDKLLQIAENRASIHDFINNHAANGKSKEYQKLRKKTLREINYLLSTEKIKEIDVLISYLSQSFECGNSSYIACYVDDSWRRSMGLPTSGTLKYSLLYGLPVSFGDSISIKDYDSCLGLWKYASKKAKSDSLIVECIKNMGGVPFIKSSTSQGSIALNCQNPIVGKLEPDRFQNYITNSDGFIVSKDISPIHLSVDLFGSIRISSAIYRVCGLKPTSNRVSTKGIKKHLNFLGVPTSLGIISKSIGNLTDFMRSILVDDFFSLDKSLAPIIFNEEKYKVTPEKCLKIGFFTSFPGSIQTVPSIKRGIEMAVKIFRDSGHKVENFESVALDNILELFISLLMADDGSSIQKLFRDEPIESYNNDLTKNLVYPKIMRKSIDFNSNDKFLSLFWQLAESSKSHTELLDSLTEFKNTFEKDMSLYDALICPVLPIPLIQKDISTIGQILLSSYTALYNILDLPAGVITIDSVTANDIELSRQSSEEFRWHKDNLNEFLNQIQCNQSLPLSVQIVSHKYHDERVLGLMGLLESNLLKNSD